MFKLSTNIVPTCELCTGVAFEKDTCTNSDEPLALSVCTVMSGIVYVQRTLKGILWLSDNTRVPVGIKHVTVNLWNNNERNDGLETESSL